MVAAAVGFSEAGAMNQEGSNATVSPNIYAATENEDAEGPGKRRKRTVKAITRRHSERRAWIHPCHRRRLAE